MPDLTLLIRLAQDASFIVTGALILLAASPVTVTSPRQTWKNQIALMVFFGFLGILGTYSGNQIFHSFANLRAMSIVAAGVYGGFRVGTGAGLIAGGHRFIIDPWGFSAVPCAMATFLEGMISGLIAPRLGRYRQNWAVAGLICFAGEGFHMLLVLAISRPFAEAVDLVAIIAMPMMVANPIGTALFIHLTKILFQRREQRESIQAQTVLAIANETVVHFRKGLTPDSARETARIIYRRLGVAAVSITDTRKILAHEGAGSDHHVPGNDILTVVTAQVLVKGRPVFLKDRAAIGCHVPGCPINAAIVVPLKKNNQIIGTLKLYGAGDIRLDTVQFNIAKGLKRLFATQFELEDIKTAEQLLERTRIRHLQAQINPHFLFNALNTIASFCRTDPARSRELILDLSSYMRKNLEASHGLIRLSEELDQIRSYLAIEKARFGSRINFEAHVDPGCDTLMIPALIIQPLVENAVKHGILGSEQGSRVSLAISREKRGTAVSVRDDGAGMPRDQVADLLSGNGEAEGPGGLGLTNTRLRLSHLYGPDHGLAIKSRKGKGTTVSFTIPNA